MQCFLSWITGKLLSRSMLEVFRRFPSGFFLDGFGDFLKMEVNYIFHHCIYQPVVIQLSSHILYNIGQILPFPFLSLFIGSVILESSCICSAENSPGTSVLTWCKASLSGFSASTSPIGQMYAGAWPVLQLFSAGRLSFLGKLAYVQVVPVLV